MLNGPCGGVKTNGNCEVKEFKCPWLISPSDKVILDRGFVVKKEIKRRTYFTKLLLNTFKEPTWIIEIPPTFNALKYEKMIREIPANAFSIPDNPLSRLHIDPVAFTFYLKSIADREVVVHMTCRDVNRLAIKSRLLGLHLARAEHVLALTGDHILLGPEKHAMPVFDLDSTRLIYLARLMTDYGIDELGRKLKVRLRFHVGAGINPYMPIDIEIKRIIRKVRAGAEFFITQVIFSEERIMNILRYLKKNDIVRPIFIAFLLQKPDILNHVMKVMNLPIKATHKDVSELARRYSEILLVARDFYGPVGAYISTIGKLEYVLEFYKVFKNIT